MFLFVIYLNRLCVSTVSNTTYRASIGRALQARFSRELPDTAKCISACISSGLDVRNHCTHNLFKYMTNKNMHGLLISLGEHENRFFQIFLCIEKHISYLCIRGALTSVLENQLSLFDSVAQIPPFPCSYSTSEMKIRLAPLKFCFLMF